MKIKAPFLLNCYRRTKNGHFYELLRYAGSTYQLVWCFTALKGKP